MAYVHNSAMPNKSAHLEIFGHNVRRLRESLRISQEELAHRAGIHRTYVGGIERGERNIGVMNVVKLARALGIKPSELWRGIE